jgi:hypothetical protein
MNDKYNLINLMYGKMLALYWASLAFLLLFTLANYIDVISPMFIENEPIEYTVRGDVNIYKNNWKPLTSADFTVREGILAKPTMLKYETAFVRLDYEDISSGLTFRNISITLLSLASFWIWLILIYQLMKILKSIRENRVFERRNINRIRIIGLVFLIFPLLVGAKNILFTQAVVDSMELTGYKIFPEQGFWIFPRLVTVNVLIGFSVMLFVFILAQVFSYGTHLKSENDLTV